MCLQVGLCQAPSVRVPAAVWELYCGQRVFDCEEGMSIGQMFYLITYQVSSNTAHQQPPRL